MHKPPVSLLAGLLALLACAPSAWAGSYDPLTSEYGSPVLQVLGWSADEKRFAVRVYQFDEPEEDSEEEPALFCPGYVDHKGKKFRGALSMVAYEQGKLLASFFIQGNEEGCTPPEKARAALAEAKAEFAKLGIDLTKPGTELLPDKSGKRITVKQGPGAPYTLEYEAKLKVKEHPDSTEATVQGTQKVFVRQGKQRRELLSHGVKAEYEQAQAGRHEYGLSRVWVSPSGGGLVIVGSLLQGGMRGYWTVPRLLGVVSWGGEPLVLR